MYTSAKNIKLRSLSFVLALHLAFIPCISFGDGPESIGGTGGAANISQVANTGAAGANAAAGAGEAAAGDKAMSSEPTVPVGVILLGMSVLSALQSMANSGAAGASGQTGLAASGFDPSLLKDDTAKDLDLAKKTLKDSTAKLAAAGYSIKGESFVDKKGNEIPFTAFNSKEGLIDAGFKPADAEKAMGIASQIAASTGGGGLGGGKLGSNDSSTQTTNTPTDNPYSVSGMGLQSGGGGGGFSYGGGETSLSSEDGGLDSYLAHLKQRMMGGNAPPPGSKEAQMAITAQQNGLAPKDTDIFLVVHTRYQSKRQANVLIEKEEPMSATPNQPANTQKSNSVDSKNPFNL